MRILANLNVVGTLDLDSVANAGVDTDRFLVQDSNGVVRYRTGAEVASDIGASNLAASVLKHQVKLGEAIAKGQAVYVSSSDGTNMIVSKASNASEATSSKTLGLLETGGALNAQVNVITEGLLAGLDTSTAVAGDPVWLGTNGNLIFGLNNKPYAPAHLVFVGIVTRVQQNNGEIFIKPQNGFELREIHDVQITTTPNNNEVLSYETSSSLYKMKSIPTLLGYTPADSARILTINGTAHDLSANRTWNVGTVTSVGLSVPTGFAIGSSPVTGSGTLALSFAAGYSLPTTASQSNWDTAYSNRITSLTTTGTSGAATLSSNVLNIPNYTLAGLGGVSGSGTTNTLPKFSSSTGLTDSIIREVSGSRLLIGTGTVDDTTSIIQTNGEIRAVHLTLSGAVSSNTNLWIKSVTGFLGQIIYMNNSNMTFALRDNATYWDVYSYVTGSAGQKLIVYANGTVKLPGYTSNGFLKTSASDGTLVVDTNTYLTGNQSITLSGDATGSGTTSIAVTLSNSGVTAGTYRSVTVDSKGRVTAGTNPTTISGYGITDAYTKTEINNFFSGTTAITGYNKSNWDTAFGWGNHASQGYATTSYVTTQINNLVAGAPGLLDTLDELAAALGDDPNFATTVTTALSNRLRVDTATQGLTSTQQSNGRTNLGLGSLATLSSIGNSYITDLAWSKITGAPSFLTAEADTLASVTGRGATTSSAVTFNAGITVNGTAHSIFNKPSTSAYQTVSLFGTSGGGVFITSDNAIVGRGAYYNSGWIATATSGAALDFTAISGGVGIFYFTGATVGGAPTMSATYTLYHTGNLTNLNQLTNGPGYITGNQNITLSGDVTGSGATSIVTTIANNAITTAKINNGAVTAAKLATFGAGEGLSWAANTDGASIIFESTGDGASGGRALSNLLIALTDNGDEGLKVTSAGAELFYVNTNQLQYKGNNIWTAANLTNLNQLTNGPGYITSSGSITGSAGSLSDDSGYIRTRGGGTEANIDTYTDNGVRSIAFTGYSQHLLSWNVGGSPGTIQQMFHYNTPANGWRIRNKTDNNTWSSWGYVVMTSANQGLISGTIATQSWVQSQGYASGGPFIPVSANTNATGWVSFSASTQGTPIIKAIQQDTASGYYLFQGVTGSTEVYRVDRGGSAYFGGTIQTDGNIYISNNGGRLYFDRPNGATVGAVGWHTNDVFYLGGHPDYGPGAGNTVRVYGFGSDLSLGNANAGDVITISNSGAITTNYAITANNKIYLNSSNTAGSWGYAGLFVDRNNAANNYIPFSFESQYGNHSWGIVARYHIQTGGQDKPSIQFTSTGSNDRWSLGFCSGSDWNFRITQNQGYRTDNSGQDGWGTERFKIDTSGNTYAAIGGTLYANGTQVITNNGGTWNINVTGTANSETLATVVSRGSLTTNTINVSETTGGGFMYRTNSSWGGWARHGFSFGNGSGTVMKAFGAYGDSGASLSYMYLGTDYSTNTLRVYDNYVYIPGLDLAISNANSSHSRGNYFRGSSSHLVIGTGGTLYLNYGNTSGETRIDGTTYINNAIALHANNYNSYAPTLTGGGASGTWGISITGNAATLGGYGPNQTGGAYTIVQRDANGYIQNSYFYMSGGGSERNSSGLGYIAGFNSSDYYVRSYNSTAVASFLGLGSMAYQNTGSYYTTSNSIYTNAGNFTTAGTGWYRVATTGSDGRGTYYVEVYTTGGNHNPSYLKILAHGDWGNDKQVTVETDGGFPASAVRITRGASNTFLEVYFTTTILGASLRVNRLGFDSSVQIYTGALPSGGDTLKDQLPVDSKFITQSISATSRIYVGNGGETLGLIGMGASNLYGLGISGAYTSLYGHYQGNGVQLGYYNGSSFTPRLIVNNGGDIVLTSGTSGTTGKLIFKTTDNSDLNKYIMQDGYWTVIGTHSNEGLRVRDSGGNILINIAGSTNGYPSRVGIGTTTPSYKLHVAGDIYADGGWMRISGTAGLYWETYGGGFRMTGSSYVEMYNNKSLHMQYGSVDYVGSMYLESGGQGVHLQPNTSGSYGSLQITSSRNGWPGIYFTVAGTSLMVNSNESGFYRQGYGWQMRWENGTGYVHKNGQGGGTSATILDTSNYTTWAQPKVYQGQSGGDWQNFTNDVGEFRVDEVLNITSGAHSNYPPNVYTYGGVLSWRLNNHSFQLYASHTGDLTFKTQWGNDNYSGWRRILHESNYNSWVPTLTGGGASGTWGISITGNAATATNSTNSTTSTQTYRGIVEDTRAAQRTPNNYDDYRVSWEFSNQITGVNYGGSSWWSLMTIQGWHDGYSAWQIIGPSSSAVDNFYLRTGNNTSWNTVREIIHSGNIGSQSVSYATSANSAVRVDGSANAATLYANNSSYGSWRVGGSRNGWYGIEFENQANLMMNTDTTGFHNNSYGWQWRWAQGTIYVNRSTYGGGTQYTVLDSGNFTSWTLPIGGSWYGSGLPGSRWNGLSVNGGEIVFGNGLPNANQMGILVDGCYVAGENNGFWSMDGTNTWGSRRGMYWDGSYLNFTTNTPTARFQNVSVDGEVNFNQNSNRRLYGASLGSGYNAIRMAGEWNTFDVMGRVLDWTGSNLHFGNGYNGESHASYYVVVGNPVSYFKVEGPIYATGDVIAYYSDRRLKQNIQPINSALDIINKIGAYTFEWNKKSEEVWAKKEGDKDFGLISQEVEAVWPMGVAIQGGKDINDKYDYGNPDSEHYDPLHVEKNPDEYKTVRYDKMVTLAIAAIKEQQLLIDNQQKQIEELKAQINGTSK